MQDVYSYSGLTFDQFSAITAQHDAYKNKKGDKSIDITCSKGQDGKYNISFSGDAFEKSFSAQYEGNGDKYTSSKSKHIKLMPKGVYHGLGKVFLPQTDDTHYRNGGLIDSAETMTRLKSEQREFVDYLTEHQHSIGVCDCCGANRNRSDIYIAKSESGEIYQLGSECFDQVCGTSDARKFLSKVNEIAGRDAAVSRGAYGAKSSSLIEPRSYLACAVAINELGYTQIGKVDDISYETKKLRKKGSVPKLTDEHAFSMKHREVKRRDYKADKSKLENWTNTIYDIMSGSAPNKKSKSTAAVKALMASTNFSKVYNESLEYVDKMLHDASFEHQADSIQDKITFNNIDQIGRTANSLYYKKAGRSLLETANAYMERSGDDSLYSDTNIYYVKGDYSSKYYFKSGVNGCYKSVSVLREHDVPITRSLIKSQEDKTTVPERRYRSSYCDVTVPPYELNTYSGHVSFLSDKSSNGYRSFGFVRKVVDGEERYWFKHRKDAYSMTDEITLSAREMAAYFGNNPKTSDLMKFAKGETVTLKEESAVIDGVKYDLSARSINMDAIHCIHKDRMPNVPMYRRNPEAAVGTNYKILNKISTEYLKPNESPHDLVANSVSYQTSSGERHFDINKSDLHPGFYTIDTVKNGEKKHYLTNVDGVLHIMGNSKDCMRSICSKYGYPLDNEPKPKTTSVSVTNYYNASSGYDGVKSSDTSKSKRNGKIGPSAASDIERVKLVGYIETGVNGRRYMKICTAENGVTSSVRFYDYNKDKESVVTKRSSDRGEYVVLNLDPNKQISVWTKDRGSYNVNVGNLAEAHQEHRRISEAKRHSTNKAEQRADMASQGITDSNGSSIQYDDN